MVSVCCCVQSNEAQHMLRQKGVPQPLVMTLVLGCRVARAHFRDAGRSTVSPLELRSESATFRTAASMAMINQQFLQALQSMFARMTTAQQSKTEALGELIKNMPKAGNADSTSLWRGLKAPSVFDGKDARPRAGGWYVPQMFRDHR